MMIRGSVFSGVMRGRSLIDIYFHRLVGLLGFEPFKGTMDVKLERSIDIRKYATKRIDHRLLSGDLVVEAYLAPVMLFVSGKQYSCWAMQQAEGVYETDIVEIIAREKLKEKLSVQDGQEVELDFTETGYKPKVEGNFFQKISGKTVRAIKKRQ